MAVQYVRLKPYDPKNGFVVRRFMFGRQLYSMHAETGRPIWYKVDDPAILAHIQEARQNGPFSPPLFDIVDEKQYLLVVEEEERRRLVQLGIMSATGAQPVTATQTVDRTARPAIASTGRLAAVPVEDARPPMAAPEPGPAAAELASAPASDETPEAGEETVPRRRGRRVAADETGE